MNRLLVLIASTALLVACGDSTSPKEGGWDVSDPGVEEEEPSSPEPVNPSDEPEVTEPIPTPSEPEPDPGFGMLSNDLNGASQRCVSALVDHGGAHYVIDSSPVDGAVRVELRRETPPSNTGGSPRGEGSSEVIFGDEVAGDENGFRTDEFWLVLDEPAASSGIRSGQMGQISRDSEPLITSENGEIAVTCYGERVEVSARYDAESGKCLDEAGNPARNDFPFRFARSSGFGQCGDFTGALNEDAYGYPAFDGVDLRGADLSDATLHFANLTNAQFGGANLETFSFGYAYVQGSIDAHTRFPADTFCELPEAGDEAFECVQ